MNLNIAQYALKEHFGYDKFRPLQEEIIQSIFDKRDTLVLMPTGGGKSMCYQIPAITQKGIGLVVSPLIALMKDQVESLKNNGIDAAYINSSQHYSEQNQIENALLAGKIKLLYVSPEKLVSSSFLPLLKKLPINLIAVDEAHCISAWGHDFRPEYTKLAFLKRQLGHIPIVALTATADKATRKDIIQQLNLIEPNVFLASFDRPNLSLSVMPGRNRMQQIVQFIKARPNQSGIIYCLSRRGTEQLSEKLKAQGINVGYYHAGIDTQNRMKVQEDFTQDKVPIICATVAFGMGIDKSNIRWVLHYNLPKNIESYYQQIGRAGRDGVASDTVLFYSLADVMTMRKMLEESGQRAVQMAKLDRMLQYADAFNCRRKILLSYFGEALEEDCGNCDVCKNPPQSFDGTILAQKALSAVARLKQKVALGLVVDVLRGSNRYDILKNGYNKIKTYGAGKDLKQQEWQQYIWQMVNFGLLEIAYDEKNALKLTPSGKEVLFDGRKVNLVKLSVIEQQKEAKEAASKSKSKREMVRDELFERLRQLRREIALKEGKPPYVVFSDASLGDMAAKKPMNGEEMKAVHGVGKFKLQKYGKPFLAAIKQFVIEKSQEPNVIIKKGGTYLVTHQFYLKGMTPQQIAEKRELSVGTIYSHLLQLYQQGENIKVSSIVTKKEIKQVVEIANSLQPPVTLKGIKEKMPESFEYHQIRFALAYYEKNSGQ